MEYEIRITDVSPRRVDQIYLLFKEGEENVTLETIKQIANHSNAEIFIEVLPSSGCDMP